MFSPIVTGPGTSVALDFPWQGDRLFRLLDELDARVADCGGRVYVAKDARMSGIMVAGVHAVRPPFAAAVGSSASA